MNSEETKEALIETTVAIGIVLLGVSLFVGLLYVAEMVLR